MKIGEIRNLQSLKVTMGKLKKFMCENAMGNQVRVYDVRGLMYMFCFLLVNE